MIIRSYNDFRQTIYKSAKEKGSLFRVMFELTYRCNFKCRHCYLPSNYKEQSKKELSTKEIFNILGQLADIGCFYLGFTGGEPFLKKDFFRILWYAKKKGFQIIIYTNGSLIDTEKVKELKSLNPNKIDITIPALSKKAFGHITQAEGCRDKVFKAIDLLHRNGVNLGFKSCLLKENEREMKEIQNFAHSLGALHRLDAMLSPRLDGDREPYRYRGGIKKVTRLLGHQVTKKDKFMGCSLNYIEAKRSRQYAISNTLFKCGVGVTQAAITPYGELKMCLMMDYPRFKILDRGVTKSPSHQVTKSKDNLIGAWRGMKSFASGIRVDKDYQCDRCSLYDYCSWCPARAWLYNKSFTVCDSESRRWAENRIQNI